MADTNKPSAGLPIAGIIEGIGKTAVGIYDANKRRQMDFAFNQQNLQAQLGLAEKAAAQQNELARLTLLAQAATGKSSDSKKDTKPLLVGFGIFVAMVFGTLIYFKTTKTA
jgi:hypothetical protein